VRLTDGAVEGACFRWRITARACPLGSIRHGRPARPEADFACSPASWAPTSTVPAAGRRHAGYAGAGSEARRNRPGRTVAELSAVIGLPPAADDWPGRYIALELGGFLVRGRGLRPSRAPPRTVSCPAACGTVRDVVIRRRLCGPRSVTRTSTLFRSLISHFGGGPSAVSAMRRSAHSDYRLRRSRLLSVRASP